MSRSDPENMAERVAAYPWEATALGPIARWPERLRGAVDLVLESPLLASLVCGPERLLIYNDAAAAQYGRHHPGALGRPLAESWPEAYASAAHYYDRVFAGESVQVPAQPLDLDAPGSGQVFEAYLSPIRGADGAVVAAHMVGFEVGARARAEASSRANEEMFRALADVMAQLVWSGKGAEVDYYNRRWFDYTGMSAAEAGAPDAWERIVHPDDRARTIGQWDRSSHTGAPYDVEYRLRRADGAYRWHVARARRMPGDDRWVGVATDIDELKRAEAELRLALDAARFGVFTWRVEKDEAEGDERARALFGFTSGEPASLAAVQTRTHPDDLPDHEAAIARALDFEGDGLFRHEFRLFGQDEGIRWLMVHGRVRAAAAAGGSAVMTGVVADITDRKRDEIGLRGSEHRLQVLMEGVPQLVWRAVEDGWWTWASPQWTEATGQPRAESFVRGWMEVVHPDDRELVELAWAQAADLGAYRVDHRLRDAASAGWRWYRSAASPVRDAQGAIVEWLGTSTDVDELRRLQESQSVLVEELQHRTRNLIAVVRAVSHRTLRAAADLPDFSARFLDRIDALGRVQGLLSRLGEHDRVAFDELLRSELDAVGAAAERVRLDGPEGVWLRSGTVQMIALGVHELATNAAKYGALAQEGGRLHVQWRVGPGGGGRPRLVVDWRESGVSMPEAGPAVGSGQGRELIERALPYQLGARTRFELGPDGVRCRLDLPMSERRRSPRVSGSEF